MNLVFFEVLEIFGEDRKGLGNDFSFVNRLIFRVDFWDKFYKFLVNVFLIIFLRMK